MSYKSNEIDHLPHDLHKDLEYRIICVSDSLESSPVSPIIKREAKYTLPSSEIKEALGRVGATLQLINEDNPLTNRPEFTETILGLEHPRHGCMKFSTTDHPNIWTCQTPADKHFISGPDVASLVFPAFSEPNEVTRSYLDSNLGEMSLQDIAAILELQFSEKNRMPTKETLKYQIRSNSGSHPEATTDRVINFIIEKKGGKIISRQLAVSCLYLIRLGGDNSAHNLEQQIRYTAASGRRNKLSGGSMQLQSQTLPQEIINRLMKKDLADPEGFALSIENNCRAIEEYIRASEKNIFVGLA